MSKKILKLFFMLLIIFSFCISYVYATDINLNLPGTDSNTVDTNNTNDVSNDQNIVDENTTNTDDNNIDENVQEPTDLEGLQPNGITTTSESGLEITNIINILLITVGVIIILLAIAIIIRLK